MGLAKCNDRYDNLSLEACLSDNQGARFQRCRLPECKSGQYCFPESDSFIVCRNCGGHTCIQCDTQWHPEVSCAEVARRREQRNEEETAAEEYLTAKSKLCPKCHIRGEKVTGCDHMSCKTLHPSFSDLPLMIFFCVRKKVPDANTSTVGFVMQTTKIFGATAITCTIPAAYIIYNLTTTLADTPITTGPSVGFRRWLQE